MLISPVAFPLTIGPTTHPRPVARPADPGRRPPSRLVLQGVWLDIWKLRIAPNLETLVVHAERRRTVYEDTDAH